MEAGEAHNVALNDDVWRSQEKQLHEEVSYENAHRHLHTADSLISSNDIKHHLKASTLKMKELHTDIFNAKESSENLRSSNNSDLLKHKQILIASVKSVTQRQDHMEKKVDLAVKVNSVDSTLKAIFSLIDGNAYSKRGEEIV